LAQGVTGAAGLAITAPIAIIDPNMRRAYSQQVDRFRRGLDDF